MSLLKKNKRISAFTVTILLLIVFTIRVYSSFNISNTFSVFSKFIKIINTKSK